MTKCDDGSGVEGDATMGLEGNMGLELITVVDQTQKIHRR